MPTLKVGDVNLYYEISGEGEPLLLLHGLGSSTADWQEQVKYFSPHYKVITYDVRGHGRSDKPVQRYTIDLFARDTAGLLKALGVPAVHVVGLSMGGMMAFQLAVNSPEMVKSMVIVNSGPALIPRTLKEKVMVYQRFPIVWLLGMRKMGQVLSGKLFPEPGQAQLRETFIERWAANDKNAYLRATRALIGWSVMDKIGSLTMPVLVISADQDYTPVELKKAYVKLLPNAELEVITNSRHVTPVDRPDEFNRTVQVFLTKVASAKGRGNGDSSAAVGAWHKDRGSAASE